MNDPYRTLGVGSDASEKEIKKAFRALTQRYHPDKNPGDAAAEAKFKEVSQAYEVLGDADRRKHWDEFGEISLSQGFDPERARAYSRARGFGGRPGAGFGGGFGGGSPFGDFGGNAREASFDDLLSRLFGGGSATVSDLFGGTADARKGRDVQGTIKVSLPDSVVGVTVPVRVSDPSGGAKTLDVKVPAGIQGGGKLRLQGQGGPGSPPGDLLLTVEVKPHPAVSREGANLRLRLPVTALEAVRGGPVDVPTPWGTVTLKLPPHSQNGQTLRLRGKGVQQRGKSDGDLLVTLDVRLPTEDDEALLAALERLQAEHNPRTDGPW